MSPYSYVAKSEVVSAVWRLFSNNQIVSWLTIRFSLVYCWQQLLGYWQVQMKGGGKVVVLLVSWSFSCLVTGSPGHFWL